MSIDFAYRIFEYLASYDWDPFLFWARIASGALSAFLLIAIGVIVKKLSYYNLYYRTAAPAEPKKETGPERKAMKEPWQVILRKLESENSSDWNVAVMQADSIIDKILKEMGLSGETMGERIKNLDKTRLASLEDLWEAHRIRNDIAHSPEKTITKHRANYAISLFEKVLREMRYLE